MPYVSHLQFFHGTEASQATKISSLQTYSPWGKQNLGGKQNPGGKPNSGGKQNPGGKQARSARTVNADSVPNLSKLLASFIIFYFKPNFYKLILNYSTLLNFYNPLKPYFCLFHRACF